MVHHRRNDIPLVKWSKGNAVNYLWGEFIEQQGDESSEASIPLFTWYHLFLFEIRQLWFHHKLKSLLFKTLLYEYLQFRAERPLRSGHTEWQISSEMLRMSCKKNCWILALQNRLSCESFPHGPCCFDHKSGKQLGDLCLFDLWLPKAFH